MHVSSTAKRRTFSTLLLASVSILAVTAIPVMSYGQTADNGATEATETTDTGDGITLDPIRVEDQATSQAGDPTPPVYSGGQVATGGRVGVLGNQDNLDTPFATTSYTSELIKNQQAEDIADVVDNDPSVTNSYSYGGFGNNFTIRGFALDSDDIALDGMYGTAPRQIVAIEMYDRVEVLKGASTFLNGVPPGSSGVGGTINLVPKRATDNPITSLTTSYGASSQGGGHLDVGRRFGKEDRFGVRTNFVYRDGETAIDDEDRTTKLGSIALDYRGEKTRVTLDAAINEQNIDHGRTPINLGSTLTAIPDAPSSDFNYNSEWTYNDMQDTFAQLRAEYDVTDTTMVYAAVGGRHMEEEGGYSTPTLTSTDGTADYGGSVIKREDENISALTGIRQQFETGPVKHEVNLGTSGIWQKNHQAYEFYSTATGGGNIYGSHPADHSPTVTFARGDFDNMPLRDTTKMTSYFLADTLTFWNDRIHLTGGVRHQKINVTTFDLATGAETENYNDSAVSPVAGIVGNITDQWSVYANYAEGLQKGETAPNTAINTGETLAPYKSEQYEIGAKADYGVVGAGIALFQTSKPAAYTDQTTQIYAADGEQENRGIELTVFGEPVKGIRILGGFTIYDSELSGTAGGTNDGNTPSGVPDYVAKLNLEYDLPFLVGATINARLIHTASQYANEANTLSIPSWTRLDLGARYTTEVHEYPVTIRANIENVTDSDYWASANGGYLTMGAPLTAKISLTADF
ncbi:TonB-dependent receptor [Thalassospira xiamenensis]|uniref:TonB-dependent receptor n=1 Tax=Thalassospira xiamenensis TaxID=220697 RepID=UPI0020000047|nr:TonB-dependent siderophore receptor [Thalassospira xiamenensis]MCK2166047.1 TonB-dependent siderophore receptor [Thalassospira xiamenensis]